MDLSVILPVINERENLTALHKQLQSVEEIVRQLSAD